ncbi:MAG: hypothetical protein CR972_00440 [Candidatus Moraniibacteriota bacterium]|nr:MAG: hypothetical protein CR972_00440 [Candidatus Moranbacteria bacterium]
MNHKNKNNTTNNTLLNTDVASVFVVQNSRKRPFIEQFEHTSINFTQKALGTILGFFIVRDESPSSENIVNFLASEVKKQYFLPTEKPVEEKFESALHRVNRALEEIANIGNVSWMGTVEGAVCVVNENSIHFSVAGDAHILLLRNDTLIDISEGLASEDAINYPLKTFVDISSGDICAHDKIIITSHELLDLISFEELQKNAIRMGEKSFIQFIETALTNECAIASALIIDITNSDTPTIIPEIPEKKEVPENFFGANAFNSIEEKDEQKHNITIEEEIDIDKFTEETPKEYIDPRTGHIHIQGDEELPKSPTFFEELFEKYVDIKENFKEFSQKQIRSISKKISSIKKNKIETEDVLDKIETEKNASEENVLKQKNIRQQAKKQEIATQIKKQIYHIYDILKNLIKKTYIHSVNLITTVKEKAKNRKPEKDIEEETENEELRYSFSYSQELSSEKTKKRNFLPHISKIKDTWNSMEKNTKLFALAIIACIIIIPFVFALFSNKKKTDTAEVHMEETELTEPVLQPESKKQDIKEIPSDPITLHKTSEALYTFVLKDTPIGIEKNAIHIFENDQESFPVPNNAGKIVHAAAMDDLNMIFFITDKNKLYSFSPVAKKYSEQPNFPEIDYTKINLLSTFMTYLYILDDKKIMRHTRIEGGFDEGKKWLKKDINLSGATSFSINDEIFITHNNDIIKLSEGKKNRYSKDDAIKNVSLSYTAEEMKYIWIIDKDAKMLYKVKKSKGNIVDQYAHNIFASATNFSVSEKNNEAYITTTKEIFKISLKK